MKGPFHDERFSILVLDYEMAREDERTFNTIQAALFGVAVALIAGLAALSTSACAFQSEAAAQKGEQCAPVPEAVFVVTPFAPFALVTFVIALGLVATIRSYYVRALEAELRQYTEGRPLATLRPIPPAAYTELMSEMVSLRRGERGFPVLMLLIVVAALAIFGGFVLYLGSGVEPLARIVMLLVYGPATLFVMFEAGQATLGGRGLFMHIASLYAERLRRGDGASTPSVQRPDGGGDRRRGERSLTSYVVLPRPEEIPKALILPLVFLLAAFSLDGISSDAVVRMIVVWISLEYLIYGARYQWNDARGIYEEDAPSNRLPLGSNPPASALFNLRASLAIAALRLLLVPVFAFAAGYASLEVVLALMAAVAAVAIPYEWLRTLAERPGQSEDVRRRLGRCIWVVSGGGYAIRGAAGLYLAGYALSSATTITATIAFAAYGTMFVTLTWGLGVVAKSARREDGKLCGLVGERLRAHHVMLRRYIEAPPPPYGVCEKCGKDRGADPDSNLAFAKGLYPSGTYLAPWNLALFVCAGLGGALGVLLAAGGNTSAWVAGGAIVGLGGALLLAGVSAPWRPRLLVGVAVLLLAIGWQVEPQGAVFAVIPWVAFAGLYVAFRASSFHSLMRWLTHLRVDLASAVAGVLVVVVGRRTAESLPGLVDGCAAGPGDFPERDGEDASLLERG